MKVIHKYEIYNGVFICHPGRYFEPLSVKMQGEKICLWAVVEMPEISSKPLSDEDSIMTTRRFHVYGTGHAIHDFDKHKYLGTTQDGAYVWHIFMEI